MMESAKKVLGNDTKNMLNTISGAYTIPLINKLFSMTKNMSDIEDFYSALAVLRKTGNILVAMKMIRSLFRIAGVEYPYFISALDKEIEMQECFLSEFLEDFYEIIDERKLESE